MDFRTKDFDKKMFLSETGYHATEHPHLYLAWLQVKLLEKLTAQLETLKTTDVSQ
jgi:hypothetical protein